MTQEQELGTSNQAEIPAVTADHTESRSTEIDPLAKGRERMASIGNFFVKTKEKVSSWFSSCGASLLRFGSKAKSFGIDAVAATLSADVLAKKGYNATAETVVGTAKLVDQKITQAGNFVGQKIDQAGDWANEKSEQASQWVEDKANQFGNFVETSYEQARDFSINKAEQLKEFAQDKIELGKDIAAYAKDKTIEGLLKAKDGLEDRYNKIKAFGEGAWAAAKMEAARIKDAYRQKMNEIRQARLQANIERINAAEEKASQRAERLRQQKEALTNKMQLLGSLQLTASNSN